MNNKLTFETLERVKEAFGTFEIGQVMGGSSDIYFRFGYWRKVDVNKLQEVVGQAFRIVEDDIDDDDCGTLYSYKIK